MFLLQQAELSKNDTVTNQYVCAHF